MLVLICLLAAAILFAVAAVGVGARINLVAAGLFFLTAAFLIPPLGAAMH